MCVRALGNPVQATAHCQAKHRQDEEGPVSTHGLLADTLQLTGEDVITKFDNAGPAVSS